VLARYPWLIAAYRFHNKVNMHSDWDLVNLDMPDHVFNASYLAAKGQDYIVHFSSRSYTDYTYTDAIDVRIHPDKVDKDLIYGKLSGSKWGWFKTDHCQFIKPADIVVRPQNPRARCPWARPNRPRARASTLR